MVQYDATMFANWRDDVLISSLSPGGIVRLRLENDRVTGEERLLGDLGRVRDIEVAPDGSLLVLRDSGTITRVSRQQ
jgi:glucose/arabinose dehydrogenase